MAKKIKEIGKKRAILAEIFRIRNGAVRALDADKEDSYNAAVDQLSNLVVDLGAA